MVLYINKGVILIKRLVVIMGFFSNVKDNMERRKQTTEYIKLAKQLVQEGNELYNRAYDKVSTYAYETESRLREHTYYKQKIANEIDSTIAPIIQNFKIPSIDISINKTSYSEGQTGGLDILSNAIKSSFVANPVSLPSILDLFVSEEDYYEAKNQKDEAKRYKQQMKYEREKLYEYRDKMSMLRDNIALEKKELDTLVKKLRHMTQEIEKVKGKDKLSNEEIIYFKGIRCISSAIIKLLSENFLNDNMEITAAYKSILKEIEDINTSVPMLPVIQDEKSIHALEVLFDRLKV